MATTKRQRAGEAGACAETGAEDGTMPRLADPSGLGRALGGGEDVEGERVRPDEAARGEPAAAPGPQATPAPEKGKGGPAGKAVKGARAKRAMGPRGRQLARADRMERGEGRTSAVRSASRKAANPKAKSRPVKGSPKARRRKGNRGTR